MRSPEEVRAELREVQDQIDLAFLAFTRQARARPPSLVVPEAYRRRAELEAELRSVDPPGVSLDSVHSEHKDRLVREMRVLKYFTGKARENALAALRLLEEADEAGCWPKNASRKVVAALTKPNAAQKWLKAPGSERPSYGADFAIRYGFKYWGRVEDLSKEPAYVQQFFADFAPVKALIERLDATRPKPVFTTMNASPLVTKTLTEVGLEGSGNARVCPHEWRLREYEHEGRKKFYFEMVLLWPEGTRHGRSMHALKPSACEACGHLIKNRSNWVPMLVDAAGAPHSLWVGHDCAKTLFGVKASGPLEIEKPASAAA